LKYERIINDGFLYRIDRLLTALKSHKPDTSKSAEELVMLSLFESADMTDDKPPPPPEGVHGNTEQPLYSQMMAALVDQVKKEVDAKKSEDRLEAFIVGVTGHKDKVEGLNTELMKTLGELEREEKKHITSDNIQTGFNVSHVNVP
jgi:cell division cycle protein 37